MALTGEMAQQLAAYYGESTSTPADRARFAARVVSDFVNEMGFDHKTFADTLAREHRTLQQSTMGAFLAFIYRLAENGENQRDLRNEYACEQSRKIVEALGPYGNQMPLI